jgi:hypothetical protein
VLKTPQLGPITKNYEEALQPEVFRLTKWIQLAQVAALGSHLYILEDGPELPKVAGSHADPGGEVLEGMYAEGRTSADQSRIRGQSGSAGSPGGANVITCLSAQRSMASAGT